MHPVIIAVTAEATLAVLIKPPISDPDSPISLSSQTT